MKSSNSEHIVIHSSEEQMGKTREIIELARLFQEQGENNIILPFAQNHIKEDVIDKARGKLDNIIDRKSIPHIQTEYAKGNFPQYNFIDLQNETVLKELKKLESQSAIPVNLFLDEADVLALYENYRLPDDKRVQRDELVDNMINSNFYKRIYYVSATWWDWLWIPKDFDKVITIPKYEGFYGARDTHYIIRDDKWFMAVIEAIKNNEALPEDFLNLVRSYPNSLIDISTKIEDHKQLAALLKEQRVNAGMMNSIEKNKGATHIAGGHVLTRSATFPHNTIFYWRANNNDRHSLSQHMGRINGPLCTQAIVTEEVKKLRMEDIEFRERVIEQRILEVPWRERFEILKEMEVYKPVTFISKKSRHNRTVTKKPRGFYQEGDKTNLVEIRKLVYCGQDLRELEGRARGKLILKCFIEQYPDHYTGQNYKTMMGPEEFIKFRGTKREAPLRFGINPNEASGKWAYVHIQTGEYTENCSIYAENGDIVRFSRIQPKVGTIEYKGGLLFEQANKRQKA